MGHSANLPHALQNIKSVPSFRLDFEKISLVQKQKNAGIVAMVTSVGWKPVKNKSLHYLLLLCLLWCRMAKITLTTYRL